MSLCSSLYCNVGCSNFRYSEFLQRVNVWNKCARKIVGYTLDEVMGQNLVEEFITQEYKEAVSSVLDKALKGEETANFGKHISHFYF